MRNPSRNPLRFREYQSRRGATTMQMLVLLVPVFFGFMGFAVDLGRLYMIRNELQTAADSMAIAAAQQLIGTDDAETRAGAAIDSARSLANGRQNKYDFGGIAIGDSTGNLSSTVESTYAPDAATALGTGGSTSTGANRFATVTLTADAPLVFFRFLSLGQEGKTSVQVRSIAGISAPLCTACNTQPMLVSALDTSDTENFGFTTDTLYTLGYSCTGAPQPQVLAGGTAYVPFLLLDRFTNTTTASPETAAARVGAAGLFNDGGAANACITGSILSAPTDGSSLVVPALACAPQGNVAQLSTTVRPFVCGLSTRIADGGGTGCDVNATNIDLSAIAAGFGQDTSIDTVDTYSAYTGNLRRAITVVIVQEALAAGAPYTVLGFRQFLIDPSMNPSDQNVRFNALYMGYPVPLQQGSMSTLADSSGNACTLTSGPGKVVLHQ